MPVPGDGTIAQATFAQSESNVLQGWATLTAEFAGGPRYIDVDPAFSRPEAAGRDDRLEPVLEALTPELEEVFHPRPPGELAPGAEGPQLLTTLPPWKVPKAASFDRKLPKRKLPDAAKPWLQETYGDDSNPQPDKRMFQPAPPTVQQKQKPQTEEARREFGAASMREASSGASGRGPKGESFVPSRHQKKETSTITSSTTTRGKLSMFEDFYASRSQQKVTQPKWQPTVAMPQKPLQEQQKQQQQQQQQQQLPQQQQVASRNKASSPNSDGKRGDAKRPTGGKQGKGPQPGMGKQGKGGKDGKQGKASAKQGKASGKQGKAGKMSNAGK
jgi:hypothetical protein